MRNEVSDDGEDYADYQDSEGSSPSKSPEKGRPEPELQTSTFVEAPISKEAFDAARQEFVGRASGPQVPSGPVNLDRIGKNIFRLSTIYYASDKQLYDNTELFLDYYDGTFHIKDFEKQCSLSQKKPEVIKAYCEQHEKERLKRLNKDKKKDAVETTETVMKEEPVDQFDSRRDLNSDVPHHRFKEAFEDSNPLNSVEFYQQLFTSFCNQLDQSTPQSRLMERLDLDADDRRDQLMHHRGRPVRKASAAAHGSQHLGNYLFGDSVRSPRSPAPYESTYSFGGGGGGDSLYRTHRGSFHSRDSGEKPTIGGSTGILHEQVESRKQLTHREVAIAQDFLRQLHALERAGRIKLGSASALDRSQALSTNPLFRYHSAVGGDDHLAKDPLAKRHEKEVYLDYERLPGLEAAKKLKVGGLSQDHYSNQDLVYSSWYDQVTSRPPIEGETTSTRDKGSLLVDLNDRSVFYSKLANMLNDKEPVEDAAAPVPDLIHNTYHFSDKTKEKQFNELKKTVRIMIANGTDPGEANELIRNFLKGKHSFVTTNPNETINVAGGAHPLGGKTTQNRMIANYYHSDVALSFRFNSFTPLRDKIKNLHRFDISRHIIKDLRQAAQQGGTAALPPRWHVKIQNNHPDNYPLKLRKRRGVGETKVQEIYHSQEKFKKFSRLSLSTDDFFLFEYTEKNPLILSNVGMASRLSKYYYAMKIVKKIFEEQADDTDERDQVAAFNNYLRDKFGEHGEDVALKDSEYLPLEGQLGKTHEGVVILENNLYRVPVFKQKTRKNDFVLVRTIEKGEPKYYLRKIRATYVAGQIQPKAEVFCPYSRQFNTFMKKFLKFYINKNFRETQQVHVNQLKEIFRIMNDHTLKKTIKMLGGEQTTSDNRLYTLNEQPRKENCSNEYGDETEAQITPEELCLYERMYKTFYELTDFGISKLKSSDKITVIKTKFYRSHLDSPLECAIARRIIQELMLSSWNLSQSFISALQTQGRMYLTGYGDPTNGHGGINFIKLPLKISRYESSLNRNKNKSKPNQMVTGTGADLRRLPMTYVHAQLRENGYTEERLAALERWDKIAILRKISNTKEATNNGQELDKFRREIRMTTKMQKEKYQSDINDLLMKQITCLTVQNWSDIPSDDDFSTVEDMRELLEAEEEEIAHYRSLKSEDESGNEDENDSAGQAEASETTSGEEEAEKSASIEFD